MPEEDRKEVATEGQDRPGLYIVRKGHFVLIDDDIGPVVPTPHRLAWKRLTNERIVFLVRDPRDICVSGAYHWRVSVEEFLERMIKGDVAKCGRWDEYIKDWNNKLSCSKRMLVSTVRYESLLMHTGIVLNNMFSSLSINYNSTEAMFAIQRQSFQSRKAQISDNEAELRRNNMRKGIAGDWRNHFTPAMNDRIWSEFGWMMVGYDTDLHSNE